MHNSPHALLTYPTLTPQPPSVNNTHDFFAALVDDPATQLIFEASIPSGHCTPTVDPAVDPASCGGHASKALPGLEACGFDGAGTMVRRAWCARAATGWDYGMT